MHLRSAESVLPMLSVPYWRHMSGSFFERPFISCVHCIEHGGGGEADTTYSSSTAGLAVSSAAVTPATLRRPAKAESWPMLTGRLAADAAAASAADRPSGMLIKTSTMTWLPPWDSLRPTTLIVSPTLFPSLSTT